jgi:hypothetical protein
MSLPALPDHAEVVGMLAAFGDRPVDAVDDTIGSLELTWLITQVEQRYGVTLDLTDDQLVRMTTVAAAVTTLRDVLAGAAHD